MGDELDALGRPPSSRRAGAGDVGAGVGIGGEGADIAPARARADLDRPEQAAIAERVPGQARSRPPGRPPALSRDERESASVTGSWLERGRQGATASAASLLTPPSALWRASAISSSFCAAAGLRLGGRSTAGSVAAPSPPVASAMTNGAGWKSTPSTGLISILVWA